MSDSAGGGRHGRRSFKRDLPAPPERSQDNYASALADVFRALDEAYMVAPDDSARNFVEKLRNDVKPNMLDAIPEADQDE